MSYLDVDEMVADRRRRGITCDICDGTDHDTDFCPNVPEGEA